MTRSTKPPRAGFRVSDEFIAAHPEADPTCTELTINLLVAAGLVLARLDRLLRPFQLTTGSFNVLQVIAGADGPLTPSQISERIPVAVTTATMTGVLDTLERRGLVERLAHPDDRRSVLVHLRQEGRQLLDDVVPLVLEREKQWCAGVNRSERLRLVDRLGTLESHLRLLPPEP